jgi:hypothetical protein
VRLRSKEVKLDVQPMAAGVSGQWLPARSVQLLEQWSEEPPKFVVGEPVTRTLAVMADGLTASQLPAIGDKLPAGVKSYPDQPQLKDTKDAKGITGLRQQKIALIPTAPGEWTLPAIELKWWNVEKRRMEVARLPERTVTVAPGSSIVAPLPGNIAPQTQSTVSDHAAQNNAIDVVSSTVTSAGWWPWLSLALGLAWLITLISWWRQRRAAVVQPLTSNLTADQPRLHLLEQQLKKACQHNDALQSKAALLAWAKARWPQQTPVSLTAIARVSQPELADAITALDRALYAEGQVEWQGQLLWQLFAQHKPVVDGVEKAERAGLEPLYRA